MESPTSNPFHGISKCPIYNQSHRRSLFKFIYQHNDFINRGVRANCYICTSSAGMTIADNIGIKLDDSTRQWTTIVSIDSATQITVTDALTSSAGQGNS